MGLAALVLELAQPVTSRTVELKKLQSTFLTKKSISEFKSKHRSILKRSKQRRSRKIRLISKFRIRKITAMIKMVWMSTN